jgi:hypothetical protein
MNMNPLEWFYLKALDLLTSPDDIESLNVYFHAANNMNKLHCNFCGSVEPVITYNGPHLQANCSLCNAFIKFVSQNNELEIMPFGKYKGQRIDAIMDKSYLSWLLQNLKSGQCNMSNPDKLIKAIERRLA